MTVKFVTRDLGRQLLLTQCCPAVQETLKSVIAQYNASQLLTMREVIKVPS